MKVEAYTTDPRGSAGLAEFQMLVMLRSFEVLVPISLIVGGVLLIACSYFRPHLALRAPMVGP